MEKYTEILKELYSDFSYSKFLDLLSEMDKKIIGGSTLNGEFLYYFNQIMNFINDDYLVDGQHITLGNMLLDDVLSSKEKITPTLLIYFYLDKKKSLGLEQYCNFVKKDYDKSSRMGITSLGESTMPDLLQITWDFYKEQNWSNEQYNYEIMRDIIHEITHVYQETRLESTDNLFDKLAFYDNKIDHILYRKIMLGGTAGNSAVHGSFLTEFMAYETSDVYMLEYAKRNSYFSDELIQKKLFDYKQKKSFDFHMYPRNTFNDLLDFIKKEYTRRENLDFIVPILQEIESIKQQELSIIEELKKQGISENYNDNYYNIFLNASYSFDGENIIINDKYTK